jgi:uncharacterized protein YcbX
MPEIPEHEGSSSGAVAAIWRYPVKSMLGETLRAAVVAEHGLVGDRAYALIDRADGKVVTAKNPKKWSSMFAFRSRLLDSMGGARAASVHITLPDGRVVYGEQDDLDEALSEALGREVTLAALENAPARPRRALRMLGTNDPGDAATATRGGGEAAQEGAPGAQSNAPPERFTSESYWPEIEGLDVPESLTEFRLRPRTFFDAAPIHLLTTATLGSLRELYPAGRFDARRFRPNLVIETGGSAFVENAWVGTTIAIGEEVRLAVTAPTERCVMTTLGQDDLPADRGILRAVVQHNRAVVGVYAKVERAGVVRQGDRIEVTAT